MRTSKKKAAIICGAVALVLLFCTAVGALTLYQYLLGPVGSYFDSHGVRIHYTDEGSGVPVVLVHGFANPANLQWRRLGRIDALKKHYRVIAFDNRGHGRSDKPHEPDKYGVEMSEDIRRLLDHLGIPKAHVVGYSMGGFITLKFVIDHPDRVLSAGVCGAGWIPPTEENSRFAQTLANAVQFGDAGPLPQRLGVAEHPLTLLERAAVFVSLACFNDARALSALARSSPQLSVTEEELKKNTVPVITIIGEKDGFRPEAEDLHARMANHTLVVLPGKTHMNADVAAGFLRNVEQFLESHPRSYAVNALR